MFGGIWLKLKEVEMGERSAVVSLIIVVVCTVCLAALVFITCAKLEIAEEALKLAQAETLKFRMELFDCKLEKEYEGLFDAQ